MKIRLKNKTIAVLGGRGMVGSDLVKFLSEKKYRVVIIDRDNYKKNIGRKFDVLINANGNSRKFWANENPLLDFEASTTSVYKSLFDFKFKKYIYISSIYLYEDFRRSEVKILPEEANEKRELNLEYFSPYSLHKYLSEQLVKKYAPDHIILRMATMIGNNAKKGVLFDILNKIPLFIKLESKLQLITTRELASVIDTLIFKNIRNEIFNVGGRGAFDFKKIGQYTPIKITVSPKAVKQGVSANVSKLSKIFKLKTSEEYVADFLKNYDK